MKKYILSIDSGTTGITVLLINKELKVVQKEYSELKQYYPKPGWVEHNPIELIQKLNILVGNIIKKNPSKSILSVGITNQRESVVLWDKTNGKPIYNTIVWQCKRTKIQCNELSRKYKISR